MDDMQKVLIKQGRKDLAQEYYKKVAMSSPKVYKEYIEATDRPYGGSWRSVFDKYKGFIPDRLVQQFEKQVIDFLEKGDFQDGMISRKFKKYPNFKNNTLLLKLILNKYPKILEKLREAGATGELYLNNGALLIPYLEYVLKNNRFSQYSKEAEVIEKNPKLLKHIIDKGLLDDDRYTLLSLVKKIGKYQKEFADKYPDIAYDDKEMRQYVPKKKQVSSLEKMISEGNTDPLELLTLVNYIKDEDNHRMLLGDLVRANPNNKKLAEEIIRRGYTHPDTIEGLMEQNKGVDFDYDTVLKILKMNVLRSDAQGEMIKKYAPKYPKLLREFYDKKRFIHDWDIEQIAAVGQIGQLIDIALKRNDLKGIYDKVKKTPYFEKFFRALRSKFSDEELKDMIPPADYNKLIRPKQK